MEISEFIRTGEAEGWLRQTDNINSVLVSGQNQDQRVYEVRTDKGGSDISLDGPRRPARAAPCGP